MFIDEVAITIKGGKGGDGKFSYYPGFKTGPDGGNGGVGGSVFLAVTSDMSLLDQFRGRREIKAEDGDRGGYRKHKGKRGKDLTIFLPIGTVVKDLDSGEIFELDEITQKILICTGGAGGLGTYELASPSNTTPAKAEEGTPGQARKLKIELKLIADYGLIGLPNAGKSSILNELTNTNVKVAAYPFTTLEPNLGVVGRLIIADIPGLIEGASTGKGLGVKFLKHIEKVKLLLHCISCESEFPESDYKVVRRELEDFGHGLSDKEEIILLTKSDMLTDLDLREKAKVMKKYGKVFLVSVLDDRYHPGLLPLLKSHYRKNL